MNVVIIGSPALSSQYQYKLWLSQLSFSASLSYWKSHLPDPIIYFYYPIKTILSTETLSQKLQDVFDTEDGWCNLKLEEIIIIIIDFVEKLGVNKSEQRSLLLTSLIDSESFTN